MALQPQPLNINFSQGLDTKTDPKQVQVGKFLTLENSIFTKAGLLQKRNGFGQLTSLPDTSYSYLTTLNGNLTAIGSNIAALGIGPDQWVSKGSIQPMQVNTLPLIRNNANQTQADAAVSPTGLVCTVYTETVDEVNFTYKYVVADSTTGQNIIEPTVIPGSAGTPRVFLLGYYFVIIFTSHPGSYNLQYIAISWSNTTIVSSPVTIVTSYTPASTVSWDAAVYGQTLYLAFNTTSGGQAVKIISMNSNLTLTAFSHTFSGSIATMMSLAVDYTNTSVPIIYASWYDSASSTGYVAALNSNLGVVLPPVEYVSATSVANITSFAQNSVCTIYYEVNNNYGYDSSIPTHYIGAVTVSQSGTLGSPYIVVRSVGLASKAFIVSGVVYFLSAFQSPYQPSYFLINATLSTEAAPIVSGKLAYSNGGGYLPNGLPSVTISNGDIAQMAYLYKDFIEALAVTQNSTQTTSGGIYSQTGINLGTFTINSLYIDSAEIASTLNISGGFLWMYDGYLPVENNFFVWPDSIELNPTTGGSMTAQQYYYQVLYSWTDNSGNVHRSAPSIPVTTTLTSQTSVVLDIPTLRLTYKVANPVKIEVYRWSTANQVYYQVSASSTNPNPVQAPLYNNTTVDYVTFTDTWADSSIIGNNIIYTTGGVIENINGPASNVVTLFNNRLWLIDAEDPNLLWFSKQVIEGTPVEMSDLLTLYVAPTTSAQGSTGPTTAAAPLDDKLILFKNNAIYYINGIGPDNTGANSQYSDAIFISSTVGCANQQSIVFTPVGLMFQSDKGIWLLGRDLSTNYIGAPVEAFNQYTVLSALNIPETNQVRFSLNNGITLMYDYYYQQWGSFAGISNISSTPYENLHTFIDSYGRVFQETPNLYLDGSNPVLMSFTTGWISLAGIQGYERLYQMLLLGTYVSPFKLNVQISYGFGETPSQNVIVTPNPYNPAWGGDSLWGGAPSWGGYSAVFKARVFPTQQKVDTFQIRIDEVFDPSFVAEGGLPGGGVTLSGLDLKIGVKKGYRPSRASQSFG